MTCAEIIFAVLNIIVLGLTVYVIKTSPLEAVKAGQLLQTQQKNFDAKRNLFYNLMAYRGQQLHSNFVTALNTIDIVFSDVPEVLENWNLYYKNLGVKTTERAANDLENPEKKTKEKIAEDLETERKSLLQTLLNSIGDYLGYKVKPELSEGYFPQLYQDNFERDILLQKLWVDYLTKAVPVFEESVKFYQRLKNQPPPDEKKS